jgi:MFS transporter, MHS family, proline/betaine transporter
MKSSSSQVTLKSHQKLHKLVFLSVMGAIFEGHDFMVFGLLAQILATVFFPNFNPTTALLSAFATFAVGFFSRPFGGIIFGYIGDRWGRKKAFLYTLLTMGISTLLVGLLPSYVSTGILAPTFLIILRLMQGLSFGGEYTSSMVYLGEHSSKQYRGLLTSLASAGPLIGVLFGSVVVTLISGLLKHGQIITWGWRVPFILGGLAMLCGIPYRKQLTETPIFLQQVKKKNSSIWIILKNILKHKTLAIKIIVLCAPITLLTYLLTIYMPTYLSRYMHISLSRALSMNTVSILFLIMLLPIFGALSDKLGRKFILLSAFIGLIVSIYPAYLLLSCNSLSLIISGMAILIILDAALGGIMPSMLIELVPTEYRCTIVSTFYSITTSIFGGTAPVVVTYLIGYTKNIFTPAYYILFVTVISCGFALKLKSRHNVSLSKIEYN